MIEADAFAAQVEREGFAIVEPVFPPHEIDAFAEELAHEPLGRSRAGARHAMRSPVVAHLARDARLMSRVRCVLGSEAVPYRATLFDKSPVSNWLVVWHQDTALPLRQRNDSPEWGPWSTRGGLLYAHAPAWALEHVVALRVSLDDSLKTNGPLRVLPDSHRAGVLTEDQIDQRAREVRPVDCLASAGSVVVMRPLTVHASSKARSDHRRRVLHIEYATSMNLAAAIDLAVA